MAKKRSKAILIKELGETLALAYAAELEYKEYSDKVRNLRYELQEITQQEVNA